MLAAAQGLEGVDALPDLISRPMLDVVGSHEDAGNGTPFDQGVELGQVAVSDDHMAPEPFQPSRIGAKNLTPNPLKSRFQGERRGEYDSGERQRGRSERPGDARA